MRSMGLPANAPLRIRVLYEFGMHVWVCRTCGACCLSHVGVDEHCREVHHSFYSGEYENRYYGVGKRGKWVPPLLTFERDWLALWVFAGLFLTAFLSFIASIWAGVYDTRASIIQPWYAGAILFALAMYAAYNLMRSSWRRRVPMH